MFSAINFDANKNIFEVTKEKEKLKDIYGIYQFYITIDIIPRLNYIIRNGINLGILTFDNFIKFLVNETWIGKKYYRYDLSGKKIPINWIDLISPSILDFFLQVQASYNSKYFIPNYILSIDSFTLKMEGIFRNFAERAKIATSVKGKNGMREVYLHNVFDNEVIKKYFDQTDRLFFNYLFSDMGLNIRNNIAHSFYNGNDYNSNIMLLLITALLRLGKYEQTKTIS